MSDFGDFFDPFDIIDTGGALAFSNISGQRAGEASAEAAAIQAAAGQAAIEEQRAARESAEERLSPFVEFGTGALPQAQQFLFDPQAQFDFLQQNPLFNLSLEQADVQTGRGAAAGGRLSAGDTLQQLSNNVLLSASPLIGQQTQNLFSALGIGQSAAAGSANIGVQTGQNIGNLLTGIGNVQAGGVVGEQQAQSQGFQNLLNLGLSAAGGFGGFGGAGGLGGGGIPTSGAITPSQFTPFQQGGFV